ncbi:uncharacterized protein LOC116203708 [Punica granatum]|uniref:RING-type E3 ubiquitin transferase n=2 Tax=Punica granatum TaxID=22663 RepID=A0A218Y1T0_PUNGR|nr:uncharacterized protein LOC116203708 [Punica granatum]OWM91233.1 hypothetical protein CDL15_Pgr000177 [Punica granatum]PKI79500.1 hypothetical protein CRG98_000131 [Punica granatum]
MELGRRPDRASMGNVSSPSPLLLALIILLAIPAATSRIAVSNFEEFYAQHCEQTLPKSTLITSEKAIPSSELTHSLGVYFSASSSAVNSLTAASFQPQWGVKTENPGQLKLRGSLLLMDPAVMGLNSVNSTARRGLQRTFRVRGPRFSSRPSRPRFNLFGYWSQPKGKLCMVGSSLFHEDGGPLKSLDAVFKLNFPTKPSINDSLITGALESLSSDDALNHPYVPVSLLGLSKSAEYEYTLIKKEGGESGKGIFSEFDDGGGENLSLEKLRQDVCSLFRWNSAFELEYGSACEASRNCNPIGTDVQLLPTAVILKEIRCSDQGKLQMLLKFRSSNNFYYNVDYYGFDPSTALIGEGEWDGKENRLCLDVCRFLNFSDSLASAFVGDCSIKLCLRVSATISIRSRSPLSGQIWSSKTKNDPSFFEKVHLQVSGMTFPGVKYEYTMMERVRNSCVNFKNAKQKGKTYPDWSSRDMMFDLSVRDSKGNVARGYSAPLSVGDQHYQWSYYGGHFFPGTNRTVSAVPVQLNTTQGTLQNISYTLSFRVPANSKFSIGAGDDRSAKLFEIFSEGVYDREVGSLCMIGCLQAARSNQTVKRRNAIDCEIRVTVQFPPLKAKSGEKIKGSIESLREKSDPLYFNRLEVSSSSIYFGQAAESIWRMDLEIIMLLVSNSLTCIFLSLQLFHVKKQPEVLPFISIVMLIVLTLGLMIPLLLNFEALFTGNTTQKNAVLNSAGGWLEAKEVIVRVVTMVAFLLQLRLLQLTWSARNAEETRTVLWVSEKKVLYVSFPLYLSGGLIALLVYLWKNSHLGTSSRLARKGLWLHKRLRYQQVSLWGHLKSYAGLVLDGFLLPQILFNLFFDSREKPLASSFYMGTTIVRLLPHAYDLIRAHISPWYLDLSYIYANHRMDFYSTAWDIIIPCGGLLFAVLVFLQQRFGGRCILPKRIRGSNVYEKVPSISNDEL